MRMLKQVKISGFRSCRRVVLSDLGEVTALIGRNSAGKTNVLRGIEALGQLACSSGQDSPVWHGIPVTSVTFETTENQTADFDAVAVLDDRTYRYAAKAIRVYDRESRLSFRFIENLEFEAAGQASQIVFQRNGENLQLSNGRAQVGVGAAVAAMPALASLLPGDDPLLTVTEPLRRLFAQLRYYPLDEPAESEDELFVHEDGYRSWLAEYTASGVLGVSVPTQILHLKLSREDCFNELKDRLGRKGLGLIDDILVHEFHTAPAQKGPQEKPPPTLRGVTFRLSTQVGAHDHRGVGWGFPFGNLSQGTRRIVRLVTAMTYGDWSVMLLEHPEDGIHKGLVRKVAGLFTTGANSGQIVLSTHSDTLMNLLDPKSIRFVSLDDGETSVRRLTRSELKAASAYINSEVDGTLSEFLHSVEG